MAIPILDHVYPNCKVPRVTIFFWIIKICCTTGGETLSDLFNASMGLGLGVTAAIFFPILLLFVIAQLSVNRYVAPLYWFTVVLTSICGTIATDGLVDNLGAAEWMMVLAFGVLMVGTFIMWFAFEKTLAIHSIYTFRREVFYWLTNFWTFAMGTAVGDWIQASTITPYPGNASYCGDYPDQCSSSPLVTPFDPSYFGVAPSPAPALAPAPASAPSPASAPAPAPSGYTPCCFYLYQLSFPALLGIWFAVMVFLFLVWFVLRLCGFCIPNTNTRPPPSLKNWRLSQWLPEGLCPPGCALEILIFWVAYVLTRPMGATIGDFMASDNSAVPATATGQPNNLMTSPDSPPGAGLGTTTASIILCFIMIVCLFVCMETKYDVLGEPAPAYEATGTNEPNMSRDSSVESMSKAIPLPRPQSDEV